jgi:hypothetical protein
MVFCKCRMTNVEWLWESASVPLRNATEGVPYRAGHSSFTLLFFLWHQRFGQHFIDQAIFL